MVSGRKGEGIPAWMFPRTKSDVSIPQPCRHPNRLVGGKSRDLFSGKEIPYDGGQSGIIADDQSTGGLADVVDGDQEDILGVTLELLVQGEGIVMQAQDGGSFGVEKDGGRGGGWLEVVAKLHQTAVFGAPRRAATAADRGRRESSMSLHRVHGDSVEAG